MLPHRESLSRLCFGQELTGAPLYLLTYASLAVVFLTAMASSSTWVPLQLVGATAGSCRTPELYVFAFPGLAQVHALEERSVCYSLWRSYDRSTDFGVGLPAFPPIAPGHPTSPQTPLLGGQKWAEGVRDPVA